MRDDNNRNNCKNCKNCKEVYGINKPASKLMAVFLLFIMVFQIVACDKKNTYEPEYVASDALWYESTRIVLERMLFENEVEYSDSQLVGVSGDYIVSRISGSYKIPDDANFAEVDYSDFEIGMLVMHDFEGNVVGSFDYRAEISDKLSSAGYDVYFSIDDMGVFGEDETVVGVVELQDKATYLSAGLALVRIDLETKELSLDLDFGGDFDPNPNESVDYYVQDYVPLGGGKMLIMLYVSDMSLMTSSYVFVVIDEDSYVVSDMREVFPDYNFYDVYSPFPATSLGEEYVYIPFALRDSSGVSCILLDTETGIATLATDVELNEDAVMGRRGLYNTLDSGTFQIAADGVYSFDTSTYSKSIILSFQDTNVNLGETMYMMPLYVDDSKVVIGSYIWFPDGTAEGVVYILDKAEVNPNVGKEIITIGCIDDTKLSSAVGSAAYVFNEQSEDAFIRFKFYFVGDYLNYSAIGNSDDYNMSQMLINNAMAQMNDIAISDILSGDGPDIILNAHNLNTIQSDEYLYDMSEFIGENFSDEELYMSIVDAARTTSGSNEGALYSIPLSFGLRGLWINETIARLELDESVTGFTFEEYGAIVSEEFNGNDPISEGFSSRIGAFTFFLELHGNEFLNAEGEVDFANETFYELSEYVLTNFPEERGVGVNTNRFGQVAGISDFTAYIMFTCRNDADYSLYGYPTSDGRGPSVEFLDSIAISANTNIELCQEFVRLVLQVESMTKDTSGWFRINREANRENIDYDIEMRNSQYYEVQGYGYSEQELMNMNLWLIGEAEVEAFEELVSSASYYSSLEPAIVNIACEEIGAYFAGQKTIEEVAETINDRAQTVLDER